MRPSHDPPIILPRTSLARLSADLRTRGKRLVLTNGVFDILHVGHVRYLCAARALGDALAVGVNDDASVRRLKGEQRPVNPEDERAEVLAALEAVDYVTIFGEDTAEALVTELLPAVYVKGGDYSQDPKNARFPPEGRIVSDYGGEVRVLEYVQDRSTSRLVRLLEASGAGSDDDT